MSESYVGEDRTLVGAQSDWYDRGLDAVIALTIVTFLIGILTLVKLVPLTAAGGDLTGFFVVLLALVVGGVGVVGAFSWVGITPVTADRVRGIGLGLLVSVIGLTVVVAVLDINLAMLLGFGLLIESAVVLAAGIISARGVVETEPSPTSGVLAGLAFALVGLFIGAALGGTIFEAGALGYYGAAAVVALSFFILTVGPAEDLGSALPVALLVGVLGASIVSGVIDVALVWSPGEYIDGDFTGGIVIPLFVLLGSIVSSWGAAKARAGYGARGRQYGAYLVVYLNAVLMVAIMVSIVGFVAMRGLTYAFHDFTIGALSGLVLLAPALVLAVDFARRPAGSTAWHRGARQVVRLLPLTAVGGLAGFLVLVQLTGRAFSVPFIYRVQQNREQVPLETAASVITEPTVGTLLVVFVAGFLTWYFLRRYGSIRGAGTFDRRVATVERAAGLGLGIIAVLVFILVIPIPNPAGLPLNAIQGMIEALGGPLIYLAALGGVGLALGALGVLLVGDGDSIAERGVQRAQVVRVGLFGGLGLLFGAVLLEPTSKTIPWVGPVNLVPALAMLAAAAGLALSCLTAIAGRSAPQNRRRILRREAALGLATTTGFIVIIGLHVALTGIPYSVGPLTIGAVGTLSWPMTMHPYIPLTPNPGGIMPAVVGTAWLVIGASTFAIPLGLGAAIFLTEYAEQGRFTALVEIATNALWSTPSIVFGLFGAAFLIPRLGQDESLMSGMLVLGFMLLPLVLITSREAVIAVPDEYRDASAALGVSKWETIRSVVLPAAIPGVITGVILGVGRIAGETAPLILVLGSTLNATESIDVLGGFQFVAEPPFLINPALLEASAALPTQVWAVISAGVSGSPSMGWASALVLLMVVLSFYAIGIIARTYFRRKLDYE